MTEDSGSDDWAASVWAAGNYGRTARHYLDMAGRLVEAVGVTAGDEVLDIGTGTGSVAITAARGGAAVTALDICPELLEEARRESTLAGVTDVSFEHGDAADLPFEDDSFDATLSNLGHMYADPPEAAARELVRVTRPGGRIGFTAWTPMSLYPRMAGVAIQYVPAEALPDFSEPPFLWGDEDIVRERLAGRSASIRTETGQTRYPALSPAGFWTETTETSGIFGELRSSVSQDARASMDEDMVAAIGPAFDETHNRVTLSYLRTVVTLPEE